MNKRQRTILLHHLKFVLSDFIARLKALWDAPGIAWALLFVAVERSPVKKLTVIKFSVKNMFYTIKYRRLRQPYLYIKSCKLVRILTTFTYFEYYALLAEDQYSNFIVNIKEIFNLNPSFESNLAKNYRIYTRCTGILTCTY